MAGRIRIPPYKPLDVHTPAVPGGGYFDVDASAGQFGPSPLLQLGLQAAEGAAGIATVLSEQVGRDDEATVKAADMRLGEAEQTLLFDPKAGYLNKQGETALKQAPAVLDAYGQFQQREIAALASDEQRRMLEELAQRRLATFGERVERHSAAERLRWHDTASEQRIAQMQADAGFHWSDDALLRRALGTTRAEVRNQAERLGRDSALTETALRQQTSRTLVAAIGAAVEHDPGRAQALRTRYDAHIEAPDRAALDALLSEAQTRQQAQQTTTEILNATPPDGEQPASQWRLQQADAIADQDVRSATIRRLHSAAVADEARARTLAEQVLARVLKDGLTDVAQISAREWVALDANRRQAIETRLDCNAAGTEPPPNPALVDELAKQMTQAPHTFARRDLIPAVATMPLPQWQRFRDWQAGIRRNDPATEDQLYAIKRGLQLATKMLPADSLDESATNYRAALVEEIDTWRRINGKSPDDGVIANMLRRHVPAAPDAVRTLEWDPRDRPEFQLVHDANRGGGGGRMSPIVRRVVRGAAAAARFLWASEPEIAAVATAMGYTAVQGVPTRINKQGQTFFYNPRTEQYITASPYELGYWLVFDAAGRLIGVFSEGLTFHVPRDQLPPDIEKEWMQPETLLPAAPMPPPEGLEPVPPPPPLPGFVPEELPPWREGFTPPDLKIPPYVESQTWPTNPDGTPFTREQFDEFQEEKPFPHEASRKHPRPR